MQDQGMISEEGPIQEFKDLSDNEIEWALGHLSGSLDGAENSVRKDAKNRSKTQDIGSNSEEEKTTLSSLRLRYEAEVAVIRKSLGGLEEIRTGLGLSRRKMCQLLMVDPSAWTRWTKRGSHPPAHVYRALQWYLALIDKQPGWHPKNSFNVGEVTRVQDEKMGLLQADLERQIAYLKRENTRLEDILGEKIAQIEARNPFIDLEKELSIGMGWKLIALVNFIAVVVMILSQMGWL